MNGSLASFLRLARLAGDPGVVLPVTEMCAAMSTQDSGDRAPVEAMVQAAPSQHKAFVWLEAGHGWELLTEHADARDTLTPLGERVTRWIRGDVS